MNSMTLCRAKPSAVICARSAATWLSIVLASACWSDETRAYRATCPSVMIRSFLHLGGIGHEEERSLPASPTGVSGAQEPARHRRSGGHRVGGGGAQT